MVMLEGKTQYVREGAAAALTIISTVAIPWGLLLLKFAVGLVTYFASRIIYRYYKDDIESFVDSERKASKNKPKKK